MATIDVKPICDDNVARKIVLGKEPDYTVAYDHVSDEPQEGETLYQITYKFHESKKVDGYKQFAGLTKEQDEGDAGACRPLGRRRSARRGCHRQPRGRCGAARRSPWRRAVRGALHG